MTASVTILGSNSALPAHGRYPSAQLLNLANQSILIDCGEGTQFKFNQYKLSKMKVSLIFISHLHGDHVFGLPGFLTSLILLGRTDPVTIIGPAGIKNMMDHIFTATHARFNFVVNYIETDTEQHSVVFEDHLLIVENIPLKHKVPCNGYLFKEKEKLKNIYPEIVEKYRLSGPQINQLKEGNDIIIEIGTLRPAEVLFTKHEPKSYAYCSDTSYHPPIVNIIRNVNLLYHEATYLENFSDQATERGHSTAAQAAFIADQSRAGRLLIGHPSSKYHSVEELLEEARSIRPDTLFAEEGKTYHL